MFLLAFHGPFSVSPTTDGDSVPNANTSSLTQLGHVLTIDARNAGFSFPLTEEPSNESERKVRFSVGDYNPYRDAADIWHVVLEYFELHPDLARHPIFLVTESYGGLRTQIMLDMFFKPERYAKPSGLFYELELSKELERVRANLTIGGQILLEPWFAGSRQTDVTACLFEAQDSVIDEIAASTGHLYKRCDPKQTDCRPYQNAVEQVRSYHRSIYDYRQGLEWLDEHVSRVSNAVTSRIRLAQICGVSTARLDECFGLERKYAYRFGDSSHGLFVTRGDLAEHFGSPEVWDSYFVPLNTEARDVFVSQSSEALGIDPNEAEAGRILLSNLRFVRTFISRARYDLLIYGPALVPVLSSYSEVRRASLTGNESPSTDRRRMQEILIEFTDGTSQRIFSPEYLSSHSVSEDEPAQLFDDIKTFTTW
jgi:hypothetical protein